jgi:hypothetical protein
LAPLRVRSLRDQLHGPVEGEQRIAPELCAVAMAGIAAGASARIKALASWQIVRIAVSFLGGGWCRPVSDPPGARPVQPVRARAMISFWMSEVPS